MIGKNDKNLSISDQFHSENFDLNCGGAGKCLEGAGKCLNPNLPSRGRVLAPEITYFDHEKYIDSPQGSDFGTWSANYVK